ncbi:hypothetical protein IV203_012605 [Nitzschia inconspicua]|uniref:Uncharacterized protein n=1 Tax=Nitzschia inconspicua TaxID=303405 RepID=A0A9K3PJY4_9STRA|nr:hypothetical protein IV203_012605 [Nitzschia inconspicua]
MSKPAHIGLSFKETERWFVFPRFWMCSGLILCPETFGASSLSFQYKISETSSNKGRFQHLLALDDNQNDSENDSAGPLEAAFSPTQQCQNQHTLGYHSRKRNGGLFSQDSGYARA